MSNAGKLIKDIVKKAKKESVMGKLGDSPYEDPMEPWSVKYAQPVKEESEQVDEGDRQTLTKKLTNKMYRIDKGIGKLAKGQNKTDVDTNLKNAKSDMHKAVGKATDSDVKKMLNKEEVLNEDSLLLKYIRSLGFNPEFMSFAQRSSYARSNAFKRYKSGHTFDREKQNLKQEETVEEEIEQIDEAGTGLLMSFIKSKGLNPLTMDGNQKKAYARSSEYKIFKMRHVKEVSGMGERGDDWNEEKKKEVQESLSGYNKHKIRVKVSKDGGEKHHVDMKVFANSEAEAKGVARLQLKKKGYETHTATHQGIDYSWLKKEEVEQIEELSSDLLGRYKKAAGAQASAADKAGDIAKGNKRFSGIMKATRKQFDNDDKKINELKNMPDNMDGDDHITREEKKMKGADPCWKGYQMVGTKKKGGRTVPNCVPEQVQEGIGGIEDSPMSATNSVKAMESEQRKKNMKSARIIKSIYKKKAKNETTYDWEKDDKPGAKVTLQGGTTMTGKPRDTVEIEPVLNTKTRPNSQKQ